MLVAVALASCGASTPPPASASAAAEPSSSPAPDPAAPASPATSVAPVPAPVPTGGSVFIGEINAPKSFSPRPTIEALSGALVECYDKARAADPELRGKVTLQIDVNEAGAVLSVESAPGGHANSPSLVMCISDMMKARAHFPKPGGMAIVNTPLVFRP
ncbi:MAG TPA: AgmX/PglI C-terminal domain-containing protein [Polyangiaceae bacterium]|nr:AgmX/PglI C-terminal domain-containing protein [Polyangiaceae bacterium]